MLWIKVLVDVWMVADEKSNHRQDYEIVAIITSVWNGIVDYPFGGAGAETTRSRLDPSTAGNSRWHDRLLTAQQAVKKTELPWKEGKRQQLGEVRI
jgi:hypothetical protein